MLLRRSRYHPPPVRSSKSISALGAFFVLALATAGCGSSVPSNSVAVVAGNPITTQAYKHWMFVAAKGNTQGATSAPVIVPTDPPDFSACISEVRKQIPTLSKIPDKTIKADCNELFSSLNGQVMDFLIKSYWYQAEARKQGILETSKQVLLALAKAQKQEFPSTAQFTAFLSSTGQTLADISFRVRVNQVYTKLLTRYTKKVTTARIDAYYTSHASQFATPETRNLRIVRTTSSSAAAAAKAALQAGQSWTVVAKKYSVDAATKDNGGVLLGVTNGEEEQALNAVAFSAKINQLVGPVHGTFGWYVVEVTKITPAKHASLAKETATIRQLLTSQYQNAALTALNAAVKKDWGTKTDCRSEYSMADCKGYKAPKAVATSTTPASTTPPSTTTSSSSSSSSKSKSSSSSSSSS